MTNKLYPLTDKQALDILTDKLLGKDWYIVDPVSREQANALIVEAILNKCETKPFHVKH